MRRFVVSAVLFLTMWFAQPLAAQSEGPRFEVVSIKPVPRPTPETVRSGESRIAFEINGNRVEISGYTPAALSTRAFRVELFQIDAANAPAGEYFAIQATLPAGATSAQVPEMLQQMLAERFKLTYHRETREYQMSVLTVGKGGMKLKRLPDDTRPTSSSERLADGGTRDSQTSNVAALFPVMNSFGGLHMEDQTGLEGIYTWVQTMPPPNPGLSFQEAVQDSFRAMIEAAGLKLETRKVPKETIVVDHLEKRATEN